MEKTSTMPVEDHVSPEDMAAVERISLELHALSGQWAQRGEESLHVLASLSIFCGCALAGLNADESVRRQNASAFAENVLRVFADENARLIAGETSDA